MRLFGLSGQLVNGWVYVGSLVSSIEGLFSLAIFCWKRSMLALGLPLLENAFYVSLCCPSKLIEFLKRDRSSVKPLLRPVTNSYLIAVVTTQAGLRYASIADFTIGARAY
jgi:hypothetical protein